MDRPAKFLRALLITTFLALAGPAAAQASHLQGGYFTAKVTSSGHLQGTMTYLYDVGSCSVGPLGTLEFQLEEPGGGTQAVSVPMEVTRCLGSATTSRGDFDVDISALADGAYTLTYFSGDWVHGIQNASDLVLTFTARVRKSALGPTGAPNLSSEPSRGIAVGYPYSQNLNATDSDGGTLSYESIVQPHAGAPDTNVIDVSPAGQVTIPASTTSGYTNGQRFRYKVRVTDSQGDWAERDVLLTVTDQNVPPAINGLASSYEVVAGQRTEIDITGTDSPGETVSISASGLPSWAAIQATPGNPASAKLVLEPPAAPAGQTAGISLDAVDDNAIAPLMSSAFAAITVKAPAAPAAPVEPQPEPKPAVVVPKLSVVDARGALAGTIEVAGNAATVGCGATGATLSTCSAAIRVLGRPTTVPGAIVSANALIGRGSKRLAGVSRTNLEVRLTKHGKRLVQRTLGGLRVRVTLHARTSGGRLLTTRRDARMLPERQLVVPTDGLFGVRGTELAPEGRLLLARIAARMKGARRVACTGHADGSASASYGLELGAARAQVVCAELRKLGFRGRVRARSKGITEPRASNDTAEGRALNRRVGLRIRW